MVVYLDLLFILNFFMDLVILYFTSWSIRRKLKLWRVIVSATIGALYALLVLFPEWSLLYSFAIKAVFSAIMTLTAFGWSSTRMFFRTLGAFYMVNFAAAGGIFGMHYFFMSSSKVMDGLLFTRSGGIGYQVKIGVIVVFVGALLTLWLYLRLQKSSVKRQEIATYIAEVEIRIDDFRLVCKGLIDTGNQLYDPLTQTPVMIVELMPWKGVLPDLWIRHIQLAEVESLLAQLGANDEFVWQDRLRLVPYRGVNRGMSFMLAIKPDEVIVQHQGQVYSTSRVFVGFDGGKLSSDESYQAIIHPQLIQTAG